MNLLQHPPMPTWDGLHPLIVHFPIALLLIAPLFMVVALILPVRGRGFGYAALVLMVIGTAAAYVAKETGEAAARLVDRTDAVSAALERHEHLAEAVIASFSVLTILYAAALLVPRVVPKLMRKPIHVAIHGVLLLAVLGAGLLLANTGHEGGRMVHQMGVTAMMPADNTVAQHAEHD